MNPQISDVHPGRFIKHGFIFIGYSSQLRDQTDAVLYCIYTGYAIAFLRQKYNEGDSLVELVAERGNLTNILDYEIIRIIL